MDTDMRDHLHFIPTRDGDRVCIDVLRIDGWVCGLSCYSASGWRDEFTFGFPHDAA